MKTPTTALALPFLIVHALSAAGPVEVRIGPTAIVIANDYLERTISVADGDVGTRQLLNKITGRAYALRGSEFEIKLNYERVGYSFGNENPRAVTASSNRARSPRLGASAVSRDGVCVSSSHDISQSASAEALP